jgi:hypothetical protein
VVRRTDGELSDAQLPERFARQRDEATSELRVWRDGPMVLGVARRMLGNLHDALCTTRCVGTTSVRTITWFVDREVEVVVLSSCGNRFGQLFLRARRNGIELLLRAQVLAGTAFRW